MRKKKWKINKSVGYGYVGQWGDGGLGWFMPEHVESSKWVSTMPNRKKVKTWVDDDRWFYKCKITIEPVVTNDKYVRRRLGKIWRKADEPEKGGE